MKEDSREEVPRIHLESIRDWERVKSNVSGTMNGLLESTDDREGSVALNAHLDHVIFSHLPPIDSPSFQVDPTHVRRCSTEYAREWSRSRRIRRKRGRYDSSAPESASQTQRTETEPYDEVLDRRIWTLSKEKIAWDRTLAERRAATPAEIERLVRDMLKRQREQERVLLNDDQPADLSGPANCMSIYILAVSRSP
jgi:hypothetical protein